MTLQGPVDQPGPGEDAKNLAVPVNVFDGHVTTPTTLSVSIEDDSPKASLVTTSITPTDSKTNLMLVLDLSASMDDPSGLTGLTRLDVAKSGDQRTAGAVRQSWRRHGADRHVLKFRTALGSTWMDVATAKSRTRGSHGRRQHQL